MKFLTDLINLVKNVRQLEEDVENLEDKVLAPEEVNGYGFADNYFLSLYAGMSTTARNISLEEKVDAIIKVLKIKIERTEKKDSEVVAKLPKKK